MAGESDDLDKLFESVADGESVDWDALEREAPDEETRALIHQLRLIAEVAEVHRSQVDEVGLSEDVALTGPPAGAGGLPIQPSGGRRIWPDLSTTPGGARPPGSVPAGSPPAPNYGVWGHLLLVRKIGEGSYGEVFHAHDTWLDHPVALKLLKPEAESRVQPSDLLHEARRLARVRHDNVVRVHGADRHNGRVGFWMDFIDGETLAARVAKGRMSAGEAASVGQEVCRALAAVHRASIIHRDVKAQNVMRAHDGGGIILMDFGAGEFLGDETRNPQGTPLYMAPELFESAVASVRTDIYAAGVLLFHLATNAFPVVGGSMQELRAAHARGDRRRLRDERPDLPDSFITIVERAIDPDPMRRYATAGDMEAKLSGEPSTRPVPAPIPILPVRPRPTILDYLKRAAIAAASLVGLTAVFGFIGARGFDIFLRVDPDFALGPRAIVYVGIQAMIAFIAYGIFGAALLGGFAGLRLMVRPFSRLWDRFVAFANAWDPMATAAAIVLAGVTAWIVVNTVVFADYFGALYAVMDDPTTSRNLSILGTAGHSTHLNHFYLSFYSSMLLVLAAWRWFPALERRATSTGVVRALRWAAVAVAFTFLAWTVLPRRIVWDRFPVVEFDNRSGLVIGTAGEEVLVYTPDEPGRPRYRVRQNAPGLQRTADTRLVFDGERASR